MAFQEIVSVIIPVFNAEEFLRETLASVHAQTFSHWEIVAALDPYTSDLSEEILSSDSRVKVVRPKVRGASAARNAAIAEAKGRWLAFLDADDIWMPNKLEIQTKLAADFSAASFRRIAGARVGRLIQPARQIDHTILLGQNSLCCSSVVVDRSRVRDEIRFKDVGCEDYSLWLSLTSCGYVGVGLKEDLVRYRVRNNSRGASKIKTAIESWRLLRNELGAARAAARFPGFLARGALKHSRF